MDVFDPENDLIDKYLRGELHGRELDAFLRNLDHDPLLKRDVEFRRLLVNGINDFGKVQLKNYLRQHTRQKQAMRIGFKTWYYAAAAVALVLVGSVLVIRNAQRHSSQALATDSAALAKTDGSVNAEVKEKNQTVEINGKTTNTPVAGVDKSADDKKADNAQNEGAVVIASNIPVLSVNVASDNVPMAKSSDTQMTMEQWRNRKNNPGAQTATPPEPQRRFKLSFNNTKDRDARIDINPAEGNQITAYNLPYDGNPQIVQYSGRYFLRTGGSVYEIYPNKAGSQTATRITDASLLKTLSR
ncbi:MAG: hypothetical protein JNL57_05460 [Bacteroidetes bacterium]|nr:hypothetical protein [Bacteroidota bacterium]